MMTGWPRDQVVPSAHVSRFQMGAVSLSPSIRKRQAENAWSRWLHAASTRTLTSPGPTSPRAWWILTIVQPNLRQASSASSVIVRFASGA